MIAFVARDLGSGRELAAHARRRLPAFSTVKVLIAAAFALAKSKCGLD